MSCVVFDIEKTCWMETEADLHQSEIIEIGAVKLDGNLDTISTFSELIKPSFNAKLSDYCRNLTHISQKEVDNAESLNVVVKSFEEWIGTDTENIYSWGLQDKNQVIDEVSLKGFHGNIIKLMEERYIDMQQQFMNLNGIRNVKPYGLKRVLCLIGEDFDGKSHRALSDSKNCIPVLKTIIEKNKVNDGMYRIYIPYDIKNELLNLD